MDPEVCWYSRHFHTFSIVIGNGMKDSPPSSCGMLWQDCIPRANFDTFLWSLALALVCPRGWPRTRGDLLDHRSCWISTIGPRHTLAPIINPHFSLWTPNFGDWSVGLTHFQPPFHCDDGLEGFDCTIRYLQKDYREPRLQTNTVLTELSKTYVVEWGGPWNR